MNRAGQQVEEGASPRDRQVLITHIAAARSAMQLPPLNLKRAGLENLRRIWRETVSAGRAAGLVE